MAMELARNLLTVAQHYDRAPDMYVAGHGEHFNLVNEILLAQCHAHLLIRRIRAPV